MSGVADPVLVTGATGRIGRLVIDELVDAGVSVRALTCRPAAARLPARVEIVTGDFAVPESLDDGLQHAGGDFVLTGPESLSQFQQVSIIGDAIGRRIHFEELTPEEFRRETAATWPRPVVDMLLAAWGATIGRPAFVTSVVSDVIGSPARTFRQWATDHASAFLERPAD